MTDYMTDKPPSVLPTIGRIVHYVSHGSADGTYPSVCRVAIVTEVPDKTQLALSWTTNTDRVSLCVLNPTGMFFSQDLPYADASEMRGGTWHWPCEQRKVDEPAEAVVLPQGKVMAMTGDGTGQVQVFDGEQVEDITVDLPKGQVASSVWIGAQPTTTHFRLGGRVGAVEVGYNGGRWTIRVMDLGSTTRYEA